MTLNRTNWKNTRDRLLQINSMFWSMVLYSFTCHVLKNVVRVIEG